MHDAGGGEVDVETVPHVAHHRSEHPLARDHDGSIKCHRTEGHQHVGDGQRDHKVVGNDAAIQGRRSKVRVKAGISLSRNQGGSRTASH